MNLDSNQIFKFYKYYSKKLFKSLPFKFFFMLRLLTFTVLPFLAYKISARQVDCATYLSNEWFLFPPDGQIKFDVLWKDFFIHFADGVIIWMFTSRIIKCLNDDSEDKIILSIASPIKREYLAIAKIASLFTSFFSISFLTWTLPTLFYYCLASSSLNFFSVKYAITYFLLHGIVCPLLFFLLFYSTLVFLLSRQSLFGSRFLLTLAYYMVTSGTYIWHFVNPFLKSKGGAIASFIEKSEELLFTNIVFIIPFCFLVGYLILSLYFNDYRKKEFR